jgi:hypothetical protein
MCAYTNVLLAYTCMNTRTWIAVCPQCTKSCHPGFFVNGSCNGSTTFDAAICTPCREACNPGMCVFVCVLYVHTYEYGLYIYIYIYFFMYTLMCTKELVCTSYSIHTFNQKGSGLHSIYTHTYVHTYMHTYIHTYMHTHAGEYKAMVCTGQAKFDQVTCVKCLEACPVGSYINGTCETGNQTSDVQCKPVSLCMYA